MDEYIHFDHVHFIPQGCHCCLHDHQPPLVSLHFRRHRNRSAMQCHDAFTYYVTIPCWRNQTSNNLSQGSVLSSDLQALRWSQKKNLEWTPERDEFIQMYAQNNVLVESA